MESQDYQEKAKSNEAFLLELKQSKSTHLDWVVTVESYIGLHYVNSLLASIISAGFCTHEQVKKLIVPDGAVPKTRFPKDVCADYLALQNLSRLARYMQVHDDVLKVVKQKHVDRAEKYLKSVKAYVNSRLAHAQPSE